MKWLFLIYPVVTILALCVLPVLKAYHREKYKAKWTPLNSNFKYIPEIDICVLMTFIWPLACILIPIVLFCKKIAKIGDTVGSKIARRDLLRAKQAKELAIKLELKRAEAQLMVVRIK